MQLGRRQQSGKPRANGDPAPFTSAAAGLNQRTTAMLPPLDEAALRRPASGSQAELIDELEGIAASVGEVDSRAAERLRDLAVSVSTDTGRLRWADVDLRRAFNTEQLAHAYAVRREGGFVPPSVDRADKVRNVMVLLPIFLTWAALAEASRAYDRHLTKNPDDVRQPFLLLWQRGFGGESGFLSPTFSTVAILDAVIIGIIIVLTFYSHGRREEREEAIQRTANSFQTDLDNVLAEATIALAPDRAGRPAMLARSVERLAERFDVNSQELLTRLQREHDRLEAIANRREKEFTDFGVFASGMRAGAEETHRLLIDLRQVSNGLQQALEDLTSEIGVASDQQRSLHAAVNSLERLVATNIQSDNSVMRHLTDAAETLAESADKSLAGTEAAAQAGRVATEAIRGIAEMSASLAASQSRLEHARATETESNARLVDSLRTGMNGVGASTKSLTEISSGLVGLKEEFGRISELSQEQSITLSRLLTEQSAIASGLGQVARDLSAVGIATSQRQREVNDEVVGLVRRLDTLTNHLGRIAGQGPGTENLNPPPVPSGHRSMLPNAPDLLSDPLETPGGRRWPRRD
ncbi:MAG TPA: methyl-accepting chemotaxis protein [Thermomicrobiales bacterium]|nr:methyl-accepting chemotaxis protein [Thermomicrobiales bacterium]